MAQQSPASQLTIGGIVASGPAIDRPPDSSIRCLNFRIMPPATRERKPYLRTRGGKLIRKTGTTGQSYKQFLQFQKSNLASPRYPICERYNGATYNWALLSLDANPYTVADFITIDQNYGYSTTRRAAVTTVRDKMMLYNGLGVRDGSNSRPPFSTYDGTTVRYCGLDAYCPSGTTPTVALSGGAGYNNIQDYGDSSGVAIYAGLHNTTTQHFSNAVYCGRLTTLTTLGEIVVSNLTRLTAVYNNATEQAELVYVFYATYDGGSVAYLILNSALTGPLTAALGSASKSLSVTNVSTQGFVLDNTQERPTRNHPPRPMTQITYANGRVYGILQNAGSGASTYLPDQPAPGTTSSSYYPDFKYTLTDAKDEGSIVWSAAASQDSGADFVGVPEESFPFNNRKYPPNGEFPLKIDATPGGKQVLVLTLNGTFILSETAEGLHEWTTISDTIGCEGQNTYRRTPRGPVWLSQHFQLVMFNAISQALEVLSEDFDNIISNSIYGYLTIGRASTYIRDPQNQLDCYKVYRADGSAIVYDFNFCPNQQSGMGGLAYEEEGNGCDAAGELLDTFDRHHFVYSDGKDIFSQESDPFNDGLIPCRDEFASATFTDIDADYIGQWLRLTDHLAQAKAHEIDVIGDGAISADTGETPIAVSYYMDLVSDQHPVTLTKAPQSQTNLHYQARMRAANPFYFKPRIQFTGHSADLTNKYFLDSDASNAELAPSDLTNCYGCIYEIYITLLPTGNRP